jgi:hypothetical protein
MRLVFFVLNQHMFRVHNRQVLSKFREKNHLPTLPLPTPELLTKSRFKRLSIHLIGTVTRLLDVAPTMGYATGLPG